MASVGHRAAAQYRKNNSVARHARITKIQDQVTRVRAVYGGVKVRGWRSGILTSVKRAGRPSGTTGHASRRNTARLLRTGDTASHA